MMTLLDLAGDNVRPLNKTELDLLSRCWIADMHEYRAFSDAEAEEMGNRGMVLCQRLSWAGVEVSLPSALFAAYMSVGRHQHLLLWAYTLKHLHERLGRAVRVPDLVQAFPQGFPTDAGIRNAWDSQKDGDRNQLDGKQIWAAAAKNDD